MLSIARQTVRARWASFAGVFIALALGVCLLATTGLTLASTVGNSRHPVWYAGADVVVTGPQSIVVTVDEGDDGTYTTSTGTRRAQALPDATVAGLAALPGAVPGAVAVPDRSIPVDVAGTPAVAHPWASAGLHPYHLGSGTGPGRADEVVLTAPTGYRPGDRIAVRTPLGPRTWTVAGVVDGPPAVYVTDAVAAELSGGRVDAVGLRGVTAAQVRAVVGDGPRVLTGDRRAAAEPDPDGDLLAVAASLLGTTAGVALFVAVFVVAGTFAFAVAQRRRELALLRAAGATPRQVRRLVLGEAMLVGVLAGIAGCAAGVVAAPPFAAWLARSGFAPAGFTARFILWPLLAAFGIGLLVALVGAAVAARRAGKVRPVEALREASVDGRVMTAGRWIFGLLFLAGAGVILAVIPGLGGDAIALVLLDAQLAIVGVALLAPILAPAVAWLAGQPLPGVTAALARDNARSAVRRTASTVAPILATVGIAAATLSATATLWRAEERTAADRITATALVTPAGSVGLTGPAVAALAATPGVAAAVPIGQSIVYVDTDDVAEEYPALYAGEGLTRVMDLPAAPVAAGTVVVGHGLARSAGWHEGDTAQLWLDDGTPVRLRVVAVLPPSIDLDDTVVLPWVMRPPLLGADAVYVAGRLDTVADGQRLVSPAAFLAARNAEQRRLNHLALLAVLGMALVYTSIAIANTLVMATGDRSRDLAVLRLAGTTPRQVLTMIGIEAVLAATTGIVLAGLVAGGMLLGLRNGLRGLVAAPELVVPWTPVLAVAGCCAVITVVASLVPAWLALRTPAARMAAVRD